jgi:hypothetical protein
MAKHLFKATVVSPKGWAEEVYFGVVATKTEEENIRRAIVSAVCDKPNWRVRKLEKLCAKNLEEDAALWEVD